MAQASKDALAEFMYHHEISAMLCGHSHELLLKSFQVASPHGFCVVQELRAGSTTQHDIVPMKWITLMQKRPLRRWNANTLLVHRVYQSGDALLWEAEPYVRGKRGFQRLDGHGHTFPLA